MQAIGSTCLAMRPVLALSRLNLSQEILQLVISRSMSLSDNKVVGPEGFEPSGSSPHVFRTILPFIVHRRSHKIRSYREINLSNGGIRLVVVLSVEDGC